MITLEKLNTENWHTLSPVNFKRRREKFKDRNLCKHAD